MISQKRKEEGFTIVELLIVIVVIGILAALVVTTFSGIQRRARDGERETDINAVHAQVEAYHAINGFYPTLANLNDNTFVSANLQGLDIQAMVDPSNAGASDDLVGTPAANVYAYAVTPAGCDNGAGGNCTAYVLTATLEGGGTHVKQSLN